SLQRNAPGIVLELTALQLIEQLGHARHRIVDRSDNVFNKRRVALVPCRVLDDQRLLSNQILEVMHDEGGETVIRVELSGLRKRLSRLLLSEIAGHLPPGNAEKIVILPRKRAKSGAADQYNHAQQLTTLYERYHQPYACLVGQPLRQSEVILIGPIGAPLRE